MIKERMLELLLLEQQYGNKLALTEKNFDKEKYNKRLAELRREFLEPYVIDSTSKE